jgi:hypothetical protein
MGLLIFGSLAVGLMLATYALEDRAHWFVLGFAAACATAAVYGFLIEAWPFAAIETVWSAVALRRWRRRAGLSGARAEFAGETSRATDVQHG